MIREMIFVFPPKKKNTDRQEPQQKNLDRLSSKHQLERIKKKTPTTGNIPVETDSKQLLCIGSKA